MKIQKEEREKIEHENLANHTELLREMMHHQERLDNIKTQLMEWLKIEYPHIVWNGCNIA